MIHTRKLQASYGANRLQFDDVSWPQGSLGLLSGASGSGKSTWLALVAALKKPAEGELRVADVDVATLRGAAADAFRARHVGLLTQALNLNDALSVGDNLALAQWAAGRKADPVTVAQALESLGVDELSSRMPHTLSGGQAQRVALARAVLLRPSVILADEPTASLDDANAQAAITALLTARAAHNSTLVIATHDARVRTQLAGLRLAWAELSLK